MQDHRGQDQKDETSYGRASARSSEIELIILMELSVLVFTLQRPLRLYTSWFYAAPGLLSCSVARSQGHPLAFDDARYNGQLNLRTNLIYDLVLPDRFMLLKPYIFLFNQVPSTPSKVDLFPEHVRGVLGNKCAGHHNLKSGKIREIVSK